MDARGSARELRHLDASSAGGRESFRLPVDSDEELRALRAQLQAADARMVEENEQPCCYARSDKYWVTDPTGIAWETFHTLGHIPVYGEDTAVFNHGESTIPVEAPATGCCVPAEKAMPAN
jgi:hypothetical protein